MMVELVVPRIRRFRPYQLLLASACFFTSLADASRPLNALIESYHDVYPLTNVPPVPRTYSTITLVEGHPSRLYVFGGQAASGDVLRDLHFFDLEQDQWSGEVTRPFLYGTQVLDVLDPRPAARCKHTAAYVRVFGVPYVYIFGGLDAAGRYRQDVHRLDTTNMRWMGELVIEGDQPVGRAGHAMAVLDSKLYVFGGSSGTRVLNDLWMFDTRINSWTMLTSQGVTPSPRELPSFTPLSSTSIMLFGGRASTSSNTSYVYGDTFVLEVPSLTWSNPVSLTAVPQHRYGAMAALVGTRKAVMWGGVGGGLRTVLDDMGAYDGVEQRWVVDVDSMRSTPSMVNHRPPARTAQAIASDGHVVYEFGGVDEEGSVQADLYVHRLVQRLTDHADPAAAGWVWTGLVF